MRIAIVATIVLGAAIGLVLQRGNHSESTASSAPVISEGRTTLGSIADKFPKDDLRRASFDKLAEWKSNVDAIQADIKPLAHRAPREAARCLSLYHEFSASVAILQAEMLRAEKPDSFDEDGLVIVNQEHKNLIASDKNYLNAVRHFYRTIGLPLASLSEPKQVRTGSQDRLKPIFEALDDARNQVADRGAFIKTYSKWAPYEAARCLRLIDEIDLLIGSLQDRVLRASNGQSVQSVSDDMNRLQRLVDQFNNAVEDFTSAASKQ